MAVVNLNIDHNFLEVSKSIMDNIITFHYLTEIKKKSVCARIVFHLHKTPNKNQFQSEHFENVSNFSVTSVEIAIQHFYSINSVYKFLKEITHC